MRIIIFTYIFFSFVFIYISLYSIKSYLNLYSENLNLMQINKEISIGGIIKNIEFVQLESAKIMFPNASSLWSRLRKSDKVLICIIEGKDKSKVKVVSTPFNSGMLRLEQGVFLKGKFDGEIFIAKSFYIKHDETYTEKIT